MALSNFTTVHHKLGLSRISLQQLNARVNTVIPARKSERRVNQRKGGQQQNSMRGSWPFDYFHLRLSGTLGKRISDVCYQRCNDNVTV
jgi:hypothetical protein